MAVLAEYINLGRIDIQLIYSIKVRLLARSYRVVNMSFSQVKKRENYLEPIRLARLETMLLKVAVHQTTSNRFQQQDWSNSQSLCVTLTL